ncbi:MAG: trypsin-like peptidase domain-containing protein [Planctomycetota bacterium]
MERTSGETWLLRPLQNLPDATPVEITPDGATLGRAPGNAVVIPDSGFPYVSSTHCRIWLIEDVPVVEDLGSKNGTLVNGRRIEQQQRLVHGDIVQVGQLGPRFAVVGAEQMDDTLAVAVPRSGTRMTRTDLTQSAIIKIKRALGVPRDVDVGSAIQTNQRRFTWVAAVVGMAVLGSAAAFWILSRESSAQAGRLDVINRELANKLADAESELTVLRGQRDQWDEVRQRLETESRRLADGLERLENDAGASASELSEMQAKLADTERRLRSYDPVNLEAQRLAKVQDARRAVVYIESKTRMRHRESGDLVYVATSDDGTPEFNLSARGSPYAFEESGSGFCVSTDGWVLTNAHVVEPSPERDPTMLDITETFAPETRLFVVFSNSALRHPADKVLSVLEGTDDMALLKIEPFVGMPHLDGVDLELPVPDPGSEVYLSGFPLGRMAIQAGETVIASTFKGILSRVVGPYMQVDAAVHPGNSGGPVMDGQGRVLGVATRVQRTPEGPYTPTIGYILPVKALARVWPPPEEW